VISFLDSSRDSEEQDRVGQRIEGGGCAVIIAGGAIHYLITHSSAEELKNEKSGDILHSDKFKSGAKNIFKKFVALYPSWVVLDTSRIDPMLPENRILYRRSTLSNRNQKCEDQYQSIYKSATIDESSLI
jgi:hypothetical protein